MKNLTTALGLSLLSLSGCQRQLAYLQPSSAEQYAAAKVTELPSSVVPPTTPIYASEQLVAAATDLPALEYTVPSISAAAVPEFAQNMPQKRLVAKSATPPQVHVGVVSATTSERGSTVAPAVRNTPSTTQTTSQVIPRRGGSPLLLGLVFIGLAALFGLLNMTVLAVVFALAAVLFLYWGLNRLFTARRRAIRRRQRRERWRDIFR